MSPGDVSWEPRAPWGLWWVASSRGILGNISSADARTIKCTHSTHPLTRPNAPSPHLPYISWVLLRDPEPILVCSGNIILRLQEVVITHPLSPLPYFSLFPLPPPFLLKISPFFFQDPTSFPDEEKRLSERGQWKLPRESEVPRGLWDAHTDENLGLCPFVLLVRV